jgi:ABC-type antimicrobial peptide transport system permease subunit
VGKRLRFHNDEGSGVWVTVVGVAANMVQQAESDARPLLFVPYRQEGSTFMSLLVRTTGPPTAAVAAARAEVQALDGDLPLVNVRTLTEVQRRSRWYLRVFGGVFFIFAAIALLLASIGIYAVIAQSTARRTQEIGVRMALGASPGDVLRLVLARGLKQLGLGLGFGLAGALAANRLIETLIYGVSPGDPVVLSGVALVLVAAGLFASWLPARRAAALHPVKALRYE